MQTSTSYVVWNEKVREVLLFSCLTSFAIPAFFMSFISMFYAYCRVVLNCRRWPFWVILFHFFHVPFFLSHSVSLTLQTTLDCLLSAFFLSSHFKKISSIKTALTKQSQLKWKICKNCLAISLRVVACSSGCQQCVYECHHCR